MVCTEFASRYVRIYGPNGPARVHLSHSYHGPCTVRTNRTSFRYNNNNNNNNNNNFRWDLRDQVQYKKLLGHEIRCTILLLSWTHGSYSATRRFLDRQTRVAPLTNNGPIRPISLWIFSLVASRTVRTFRADQLDHLRGSSRTIDWTRGPKFRALHARTHRTHFRTLRARPSGPFAILSGRKSRPPHRPSTSASALIFRAPGGQPIDRKQ